MLFCLLFEILATEPIEFFISGKIQIGSGLDLVYINCRFESWFGFKLFYCPPSNRALDFMGASA